MLRQCQHKLAFSKSSWYTSALRTFIPNSEIKLTTTQLWKYQYRSKSSLASSLKSMSSDDMQTTFVTPSPLPLIEPLQLVKNTFKFEAEKIVILEKYRRCSGYRRYDGHRCERLVKTDPSLPITDQVVCFNHDNSRKLKNGKKKVRNKAADIRLSENRASEETINSLIQQYSPSLLGKKKIKPAQKLYDCWDLWIGQHIAEPQRTLIRQEMGKATSNRDKEGFIYVYSTTKGPRVSKDTHAYFKIGRTTDPHRRMYQVSNVCKLEPRIIELFPSFPVVNNQQTLTTNLETLQYTLDQIPKCPLSHRVERLIHLELSSLYRRAGFKCVGCGKTHREWIRVNRRNGSNGKPMTDAELWLSCIRPVILKWVQYGVAVSAINK